MILTLSEVKKWLRLEEDYTIEDDILQALLAAAQEYIRNAVPSWIDLTSNPLAKLLARVLIADWYENREAIGRVREEMRLTVTSLLAQLQYAYPDPVETEATPDA